MISKVVFFGEKGAKKMHFPNELSDQNKCGLKGRRKTRQARFEARFKKNIYLVGSFSKMIFFQVEKLVFLMKIRKKEKKIESETNQDLKL